MHPAPDSLITKHFLISGRVQGVGFRRFVQAAGRSFGVKGSVRNLEDGRVETIANGSKDVMVVFEKELATGPLGSNVTDIVAREVDSSDYRFKDLLSNDFAMKPDGRNEWL